MEKYSERETREALRKQLILKIKNQISDEREYIKDLPYNKERIIYETWLYGLEDWCDSNSFFTSVEYSNEITDSIIYSTPLDELQFLAAKDGCNILSYFHIYFKDHYKHYSWRLPYSIDMILNERSFRSVVINPIDFCIWRGGVK